MRGDAQKSKGMFLVSACLSSSFRLDLNMWEWRPPFFTDLRTTSCFFFLLKESFDESEAWGVGVSFPGCAL